MRLVPLSTVLVLAAVSGTIPLAGQDAGCPGEAADQAVKLSYPLEAPVDSLRPRIDSLLQALGYSRGQASGGWEYQSLPRFGWPVGTENAPWRNGDVAPGAIVSLKFVGKKKGQVVLWVEAEALCAQRSRKASTDDNGIEHMASLFAAMQVVVAFEAGVEAATHAFDQRQ